LRNVVPSLISVSIPIFTSILLIFFHLSPASEMAPNTRACTQTDSAALLCSGGAAGLAACRARLEADGYLLLRGFLPRADVLRARAFLLESLAADGFIAPLPPARESASAGSARNSNDSASSSSSANACPSAASAAAGTTRFQSRISERQAAQSAPVSTSTDSSKRRRSERVASRLAPPSNEISATAAPAASSLVLHSDDEQSDDYNEFEFLDSKNRDDHSDSTAYEWAAAHPAVALDATASPGYLGRADLHAAAPVHALVEHARLRRLFAAWFACAPKVLCCARRWVLRDAINTYEFEQ
jgi:hypothetical protein